MLALHLIWLEASIRSRDNDSNVRFSISFDFFREMFMAQNHYTNFFTPLRTFESGKRRGKLPKKLFLLSYSLHYSDAHTRRKVNTWKTEIFLGFTFFIAHGLMLPCTSGQEMFVATREKTSQMFTLYDESDLTAAVQLAESLRALNVPDIYTDLIYVLIEFSRILMFRRRRSQQ